MASVLVPARLAYEASEVPVRYRWAWRGLVAHLAMGPPSGSAFPGFVGKDGKYYPLSFIRSGGVPPVVATSRGPGLACRRNTWYGATGDQSFSGSTIVPLLNTTSINSLVGTGDISILMMAWTHGVFGGWSGPLSLKPSGWVGSIRFRHPSSASNPLICEWNDSGDINRSMYMVGSPQPVPDGSPYPVRTYMTSIDRQKMVAGYEGLSTVNTSGWQRGAGGPQVEFFIGEQSGVAYANNYGIPLIALWERSFERGDVATLTRDPVPFFTRRKQYAVAIALPTTLWYFLDSTTGGWPTLQMGGSAPSVATTTTGWRVEGLAAGQYARMEYGVTRATSAFSATPQPSGAPDNTLKDCWRSPTALNGTVAAGDWLPSLPLIAVAGEGADVRMRFRLWRSTSADGSSATEITSGAIVGTTITTLLDDVTQISAGTVNLPEVTLANEYLFVQVALETV